MGNDEDNRLRVYASGQDGGPVDSLDLSEYLGLSRREADIEAATRIGDRIYWITSHGRNKDGEWRPDRHRFFATVVDGAGLRIDADLAVSRTLAADLVAAEPLHELALDAALQADRPRDRDLAPKRRGLNIEGLAVAPGEDAGLWIGFRNPRPRGKALLVPLRNPAPVVEEGAQPEFGAPILLDLGGRGIREIQYSPAHRAFLLIAGSADGKAKSSLYRWTGQASDEPVPVAVYTTHAPGDFNPEAILVRPGDPAILLLSDDGGRRVPVADRGACTGTGDTRSGSCECGNLRDSGKKTFRSLRLEIND